MFVIFVEDKFSSKNGETLFLGWSFTYIVNNDSNNFLSTSLLNSLNKSSNLFKASSFLFILAVASLPFDLINALSIPAALKASILGSISL